ncbi:hypothetical protein GOV09_04630, partial [Candidatus Woesearchaeota archaeon]|nr:hypothetical protein [Candidatus Woesearchaeota archaeon]
IIIVLLSFSLVQAVQINSLKDKISEGSVAYASPQKTFQAQAPLKAPTMVGGC